MKLFASPCFRVPIAIAASRYEIKDFPCWANSIFSLPDMKHLRDFNFLKKSSEITQTQKTELVRQKEDKTLHLEVTGTEDLILK
jgi:hypothetical protein